MYPTSLLWRHYSNEDSPLSDTLQRYNEFFSLFQDFQGYVDFFLLQDLVKDGYLSIKFYLPFVGFDNPALPDNIQDYRLYKENMTDFVSARNQRIQEFASGNPLSRWLTVQRQTIQKRIKLHYASRSASSAGSGSRCGRGCRRGGRTPWIPTLTSTRWLRCTGTRPTRGPSG